LAELNERERMVLTLRYGGDLNATEVGAITKLSAANVRKLCERLRGRLGTRLAALAGSYRAGPDADAPPHRLEASDA
jgi:DNA-directed RNA polymerase specialized sigma subunit